MYVLDEKDNVGVSLTGEEGVPAGHKIARRAIANGEEIIKYGHRIGRATADIRAGEWVHTHNMRSALDESVAYRYEPKKTEFSAVSGTFRGYRRTGRRAGIRNEIYVIPTVGCVNGVCNELVARFEKEKPQGVDGVYALTHPFGCSQLGEDHENLKKILCGLALNPNAAGVLFVGLGCENNGIVGIRALLEGAPTSHIRFLIGQEEEDEIQTGLRLLGELGQIAAACRRETLPLSELCIGLKCGGSDGFSGITANPTLGKVSERLIAAGGSAVLTEVPEMFGAEQILMDRCENEEVFGRFCAMIENFKKFYTEAGFPVYENPSPGNREGGITTLEEKSLGCIRKGGNCTVKDVLAYGERVKVAGLSALDGPGNDLIASTALAAAGCQVVLFTTGRGTPFSTAVPTLKIASNAALARKKHEWIDFDASGSDADGLFGKLLAVCNGEPVKAERRREIAFFKTGVTL